MDPGNTSQVRVLGIDPAPKKDAAVWSSHGCQPVAAGGMRRFLTDQLRSSCGLLVVWDSPLAFNPAGGFSDRRFDRAARAWVADQVKKDRIEKGAVSVRPFSGCPHWAHSCHVLGLPFGEGIGGLELYSGTLANLAQGHGLVVETHPAVALAALWIERQLDDRFPRYKGSKATAGVPATIAEKLGFPEEAGADDDALDAFVAYRLGVKFSTEGSTYVGDPNEGGYLLPNNPAAREVEDRFQTLAGK